MRAENLVNCPSCGATLVAGMRFCRMCGYRLGEGVEEYAATQLFDRPPATAPQAPPATDPFAPKAPWGAQPMAPFQPGASFQSPTAPLQQGQGAAGSAWTAACAPKRAGWMWTLIIIVSLVILGVGV